jgi:hypothetical protein
MRLEGRGREARMQRVVRVPPVLITPEILPTTLASACPPICCTIHAVLQNLSKGFTLTFAPNPVNEGGDLEILMKRITRLDRMKITYPKQFFFPKIRPDLEQL